MRRGCVVCVGAGSSEPTVPTAERRPQLDLVEHDFTASAPDQVLVEDVMYIPACACFLYLAIVLVPYSFRVLGWSMTSHLRSPLAGDASDMALGQHCSNGVIQYSDEGCQCTFIDFGQRCRQAEVSPCTGPTGGCHDNAMAESVLAWLECESLDQYRFADPAQARRAVLAYIEGGYNPQRCHSAIGFQSPNQYDKQCRGEQPDCTPEQFH